MYQLKLGTSIPFFDFHGIREAFYKEIEEIKKLGFYSVDLSLSGVGGYNNTMEKCIKTVDCALNTIKESGLKLNGIHLPFWRFIYITSCDEDVRAWCMNEYRDLINVCNPYKPDFYIFHSKTNSSIEGVRKKRKPMLYKSFQEMTEMTDSVVCLENMIIASDPETSADAIEIINRVPKGKICADVNHFLLEKPEEALLKLGERVATLHISDNDGVSEKHWMPKQGVIDWINIIGALEKIGYNGVFNYEVDMNKFGYSFEDIKHNYEKLFEEYNKR